MMMTPKALKFVQAGNYRQYGSLITGTFIHALLVHHVASWISAEFALKVNRIVNNFLIAEYQAKMPILLHGEMLTHKFSI
jgi:hypothetical protein